ncbi:MAG: hypothetical protein PHN82_00025 [bacterium]|nr:hypothetical protein [bacterium]
MSAGTLRMSLKERERMRVMSRVKERGMKLTEAKMLLEIIGVRTLLLTNIDGKGFRRDIARFL